MDQRSARVRRGCHRNAGFGLDELGWFRVGPRGPRTGEPGWSGRLQGDRAGPLGNRPYAVQTHLATDGDESWTVRRSESS